MPYLCKHNKLLYFKCDEIYNCFEYICVHFEYYTFDAKYYDKYYNLCNSFKNLEISFKKKSYKKLQKYNRNYLNYCRIESISPRH